MTKMLTRAVLGAAACLVATAGTAGAADLLEIKVPFEFVAHGQTFPAGQYTLERNDFAPSVFMIRGENGNTAGAFVATVPANGPHPAGNMPAVQFKRHENQYRLVSIWESATDGQRLVN